MAVSRRAVFLDKDGTLVENVPYNADPDRVVLTPRAGAALRRLAAAGFELYIVSNQSGLARGYFSEDDLAAVENRLRSLLRAEGVELDGFYYCPHHPEGTVRRFRVVCRCRKPAPALLTRACREHNISAEHSWLIGDILDDVEAGRRAGCRTVLVDNGNETEWELDDLRVPHYVASDLSEAADYILSISEPGLPRPVSEGARDYEPLTA